MNRYTVALAGNQHKYSAWEGKIFQEYRLDLLCIYCLACEQCEV